MDPQKPEDRSTLTAIQNETVELLGRVLGHTFADRYTDFCLLASGSLPLRVSRPLAAHAIREFESSLREALTVHLKQDAKLPADEAAKLEKAAIALKQLGFDVDAVKRANKELAPRDNHKAQIDAILTWLGCARTDPVYALWGRLRKVMKSVHERSFHDLLMVDETFRREFQEPFEAVVLAVATGLQRRYSEFLLRVEALAATPDREAAVSAFIKEVPGAPPLQWHFFNRLETPDWLPYLLQQGLLKPPFPHAVTAFPFGPWPAGRYLEKMARASDQPVRGLVVEAVRVAANSARPDVKPAILRILCAMPPGDAARFSDDVVEWLQTSRSGLPNHEIEQLVRRLAEHGHADEALKITQALLWLERINGEPVTRYSRGMYEHKLPGLVNVITRVCGLRALELFIRLLVLCAVAEGKSITADRDTTAYTLGPVADDYYAEQDLYSALIRAVRMSAEQLLEADAVKLHRLVEALRAPELDVLRRIALHVLAIAPSAAPELATSSLLDVAMLENTSFSHEYAALATAWFPLTTPEDQDRLTSLVMTVPDRYVDAWKTRRHWAGQTVTDRDVEDFRATTVRDITKGWQSVLPGSLQEELAKTAHHDVERFGSEATRYVRAADLLALSNAEIMGLLSTSYTAQASDDGLEHEWQIAVSQDPARFANAAAGFGDLPLRCLGVMLRGLAHAGQNSGEVQWESVLVLLRALTVRVASKNDNVAQADTRERLNVMQASAELLAAGMLHERGGIPFQHRELIDQLLIDSLRTVTEITGAADLVEEHARNLLHAARSTPVGAWLNTAFMRLRWGAVQRRADPAIPPAVEDGEPILCALTRCLAMPGEHGRVVRAMMGAQFGLLHYVVADWADRHFESVFHWDDPVQGDTAWSAYIEHASYPASPLYPRMRGLYERELVRSVGEAVSEDSKARQAQFAHHLLMLYLDGAIELTEPVMERFFQVAPVRQRTSLMWTLDGILRSPPEQLTMARRQRAFAYWRARLAAASVEGVAVEEYRDEIGVIGRWADNPQLDSLWVLDQVVAALGAGFTPSLAFNVVQRLADASAHDIERTMGVLAKLVADRELDHDILVQRGAIRTVLNAALNSQSSQAIEQAERLISLLATRGEMDYLDLLGR